MNERGKREEGGIGFLGGMLLGVVFGMLFGAIVSGALAYFVVKKKEADVRRGWNLVPVVVASRDMSEKTVLTFDDIAQRQVPEQFVTKSVIRPDSASYIVNQPILVPVQAGDVLLWSQFESPKSQVILIAARDLPAGAVLAEADVQSRAMPEELLTPSYARQSDRPQLVGRRVQAPFRQGDPVLWTHFQAEPAPVSSSKGR